MSLILSKIYKNDIRGHGSGNAGTTNTLRIFGKKAAIFSLIGDLLKGIIACVIGYYLSSGDENFMFVCGFGSILGHVWPVYFGFKGGKGVLTTFAVLLMMDWKLALTLLGIFVIIVVLSKMVSLGSVIVAVLFPTFSIVGLYSDKTNFYIFSTIILGTFVVFLHRENIKRILNGTESKIGSNKR
jgi:glycerol-3-phosphate acyltransferase PlsY